MSRRDPEGAPEHGARVSSAPRRWLLAPWVGLARLGARRPRLAVVLLVGLSVAGVLGARRVRLSTDVTRLVGRREGGPLAGLALHASSLGAARELVLLVSRGVADRRAGGDGVGDEDGRAALLTHATELARRLRAAPFADPAARIDADALGRYARRHALLLIGLRRHRELASALSARGRRARLRQLRRALLAPVGPDPRDVALDPLGIVALVGRGPIGRQARSARGGARSGGVARGGPTGGVALSPDGRHALLSLRLRRGYQRAQLARVVEAERARLGRAGLRLRASGAPMYAAQVERRMRGDLTVSAIAGTVAATLLLLVLLRWWPLLVLAPLTGGVAVALVLAVAAAAGVELGAVSLAFAAICIGLGVDSVVHLAAVMPRRPSGAGPRAATVDGVEGAAAGIAPALAASSLTTVGAFAALALARFAGLAQTGLLAALGLGLAALVAALLVPAVAARVAPKARDADGVLGAAWARWIGIRAGPVLLVAAALAVAAGLACTKLRVAGGLSRLSPADIAAARTDGAIAKAFERARHRLVVLVRAPTLEGALALDDAVYGALAGRRDVAQLASLAPLLPSRATLARRRRALSASLLRGVEQGLRRDLARQGFAARGVAPFLAALRSPPSPPPASKLLAGPLRGLAARLVGRAPDGRVLVATRVVARDAAASRRVVAALSQLGAAKAVARAGASAGHGGAILLSSAPLAARAVRADVAHDLRLVALVAAALVTLALALLLRSAWAVLAALLSLALSCALFGAALVLLDLPLDLYSALIAPLLVGYGVDDHIYVARAAQRDGLGAALSRAGRAVVATTATSAAALGALGFCSIEGLRRLGLTAAVGLGASMLCALVVLPALLSLAPGARRASGSARAGGGE